MNLTLDEYEKVKREINSGLLALKRNVEESYYHFLENLITYKLNTKCYLHVDKSGDVSIELDHINRISLMQQFVNLQYYYAELKDNVSLYMSLIQEFKKILAIRENKDALIISALDKYAKLNSLGKVRYRKYQSYDLLDKRAVPELARFLKLEGTSLDYEAHYPEIIDYIQRRGQTKEKPKCDIDLKEFGLDMPMFSSTKELDEYLSTELNTVSYPVDMPLSDLEFLMDDERFTSYEHATDYMLFKKFKEDNDDEYETKYYNYRKKVKAIRDDIAAKMVDINFSDFSLDMIDKAYDEIKNSLSQERMEFPRLKYKVDELTAKDELDINPDKKKLYNRYKNMDSESLYILLANTEPSALEEREMIREILEYRKNNDFEKVLSSRKVFNRKYRSLDDLLSRLNKNKQKVKRRVKK